MKILYLGTSSEELERLKRYFEVMPLNLRKCDIPCKDSKGNANGKTWGVYAHSPEGADAIFLNVEVSSLDDANQVIQNGIDYADCFFVPIILKCPRDVYQSCKAVLELLSTDNKICYVAPEIDDCELVEAVHSTVSMSVPYSLLEFPS